MVDAIEIEEMARHDKVTVMACLLRTMGTNLNDEREVVRVLTGARVGCPPIFESEVIRDHMDDAIAEAKCQPSSNLETL